MREQLLSRAGIGAPSQAHQCCPRGGGWGRGEGSAQGALPGWCLTCPSPRFVQYKATSLEKQHKHDLLTEPDLGVTIDLINPDTYRIDPNGESRAGRAPTCASPTDPGALFVSCTDWGVGVFVMRAHVRQGHLLHFRGPSLHPKYWVLVSKCPPRSILLTDESPLRPSPISPATLRAEPRSFGGGARWEGGLAQVLSHPALPLPVLLDPADEKLLEEEIQAPTSSKR